MIRSGQDDLKWRWCQMATVAETRQKEAEMAWEAEMTKDPKENHPFEWPSKSKNRGITENQGSRVTRSTDDPRRALEIRDWLWLASTLGALMPSWGEVAQESSSLSSSSSSPSCPLS